mmetsp:Transcript_15581/g.42540  ORF Transcript_15581/g.42540 Transcript_15581/m.42540 type:complete len:96 (-) Transcript_15581:163-450(-)
MVAAMGVKRMIEQSTSSARSALVGDGAQFRFLHWPSCSDVVVPSSCWWSQPCRRYGISIPAGEDQEGGRFALPLVTGLILAPFIWLRASLSDADR